jgi:hypothetical protein
MYKHDVFYWRGPGWCSCRTERKKRDDCRRKLEANVSMVHIRFPLVAAFMFLIFSFRDSLFKWIQASFRTQSTALKSGLRRNARR